MTILEAKIKETSNLINSLEVARTEIIKLEKLLVNFEESPVIILCMPNNKGYSINLDRDSIDFLIRKNRRTIADAEFKLKIVLNVPSDDGDDDE